MLYNGNRENLAITKGKAGKAFKQDDAAIMATVVNADGSYKRHIILEEPELRGYRLRPSMTRWMQPGYLLLYLESKRKPQKHRLARLKTEPLN